MHNGYRFNEDGSLFTINQHLKNDIHPKTGVPFRENRIILDGKEEIGVFPVFDSKFTTNLPDNLLIARDNKQFRYCTQQLAKQIEKNPELAKNFTSNQLKDIMNGNPRPDNLTWHHYEDKSVMQLVNYDTHYATGHTGGNLFWGEGVR